jgi:predicted house-cleaning noncanonical NTP pyrophosphatase (MazG superfamily)
MTKDYSRFVSKEAAYKEMKKLLEQKLGRELTELEDRKINWFADCEYETVGVFVDLFKELSSK